MLPVPSRAGGPGITLEVGSAQHHVFSSSAVFPSSFLTRLCFSFYFRKLHPLQMALPGRAPGCCPLGKATLCTPSSDQATLPFPSSTKAPTAGRRTISLPLRSPGRSDSERRQPRLLRGPSPLCRRRRTPPRRTDSADRREQLRQPRPQPPTDPR